jgi:hypothetical protein
MKGCYIESRRFAYGLFTGRGALARTLFACIACEIKQIRIPALSRVVMALVGNRMPGRLACHGRGVLQSLMALVPAALDRILALLLMGSANLFEDLLKRWVKRHLNGSRQLAFRCFDLSFVLGIYVDNTKADWDDSKVLLPARGVFAFLPAFGRFAPHGLGAL